MATNPARKKSNPADQADQSINIIKESTCPTSTGKSTLGYQVGVDEGGGVLFKLTSNSGGGNFTSSWISLSAVWEALKAWPEDRGITSMALRSLSRGKSANDAGFAIAVLVAEGLLHRINGKSRVHEAVDAEEFTARVDALRSGGGNKPGRKPRTKAKAPAKKKAAAKPATKTTNQPTRAKAKAKSPRRTTATKRKAK